MLSQEESMPDVSELEPKRQRRVPVILVVVFAVLVAIAALPHYLSGEWPWSKPLEVPRIGQLQALRTEPLDIPDWNLVNHQEVNISGNRWSLGEYQPTATSESLGFPAVVLLLRPQPWHTNQPEVEWVDINGAQEWRTDNQQTLRFSIADGSSVTARYFRGITPQRTFAVVQWYAWAKGGHSSPNRWFWLDQMRQWQRRERLPWVAVSLLLPIEPVGNIDNHADNAEAIAQAIQTALVNAPFAGME
jgi:cyanoexosortase B-associated protein